MFEERGISDEKPKYEIPSCGLQENTTNLIVEKSFTDFGICPRENQILARNPSIELLFARCLDNPVLFNALQVTAGICVFLIIAGIEYLISALFEIFEGSSTCLPLHRFSTIYSPDGEWNYGKQEKLSIFSFTFMNTNLISMPIDERAARIRLLPAHLITTLLSTLYQLTRHYLFEAITVNRPFWYKMIMFLLHIGSFLLGCSLIFIFTMDDSNHFSFTNYWEFIIIGSLLFALYDILDSLLISVLLVCDQMIARDGFGSSCWIEDVISIAEIFKVVVAGIFFLYQLGCGIYTISIGDWNFITICCLIGMLVMSLGSLIGTIGLIVRRKQLFKQISLMAIDVRVSTHKQALTENICTICQVGFSGKNCNPLRTPCGHYYHTRCLRKWLRIRQVCPNCNGQLDLQNLERLQRAKQYVEVQKMFQAWMRNMNMNVGQNVARAAAAQ